MRQIDLLTHLGGLMKNKTSRKSITKKKKLEKELANFEKTMAIVKPFAKPKLRVLSTVEHPWHKTDSILYEY